MNRGIIWGLEEHIKIPIRSQITDGYCIYDDMSASAMQVFHFQ